MNTKPQNANELLFRPSSMSDIMSGVAKKWTVENSLTCKRKLVEMYRSLMWNRRPMKSNKYTEKGTKGEDDSITLYSLVKKQFFKKNDQRLTNAYFTGELDLYQGESIMKAEVVVDIKTSWDWTTFPSLLDTESKDYIYQGHGYMDLTGAKKFIVVHCLINTPAELILDEMKRLQWKMQVLDPDADEEYIEMCKKIEQTMIVDLELFKKHYPFYEFKNDTSNWIWDIPMEERVHEIVIQRDEYLLDQMKARVLECRTWMNNNLFK
jgi:hypothetical protein